jgi:ankyrin repeat protein
MIFNIFSYFENKSKQKKQNEFFLAIKMNNFDKVSELIDQVNPANKDNWAIYHSSIRGYTEIVELLLKDPKVYPCSAISLAAQEGHLEVVKLLINDERVHSKDYDILRRAAKNGNFDIIEYLIKLPFYNNLKDIEECFIESAYHGHYNIVELLLNSNKLNPTTLDNRATSYAARNGHAKVFRLLINNDKILSSMSKFQHKDLLNTLEKNMKNKIKGF